MAVEKNDKTVLVAGGLGAGALVLWVLYSSLSSGSVSRIELLKPSETAFLVPPEMDSGDGKKTWMSEEFLAGHMVKSGSVSVPERKVSSGRFSSRWVPSVLFIKVDRAPVTIEWKAPAESDLDTSSDQTGTTRSQSASKKEEKSKEEKNRDASKEDKIADADLLHETPVPASPVSVESKDGVQFTVDMTVTTSIPENWTAKFTSHYVGKPLWDVTNEEVRGYISGVLNREFGSRSFEECRKDMHAVFNTVLTETKNYFADRGVSVDNLSSIGNFTFSDRAVQAAMDADVLAQLAVSKAHAERMAQQERNKMIVERAVAENEAALEFAKNGDAAATQKSLEIEMLKAQITQAAVDKWNGIMPAGIVPQGTGLTFGLDKSIVSPSSSGNSKTR